LNLTAKHTRLVLDVLSVVTVVVLITAVFSNLTAVAYKINMFFCSDTLYLPSVYKDLFLEKGELNNWHFNPAPNFFPDMPFYFLLMFLTNNFIWSSFLFSFAQCLFLAFLLVKIFKFIFPDSSSYYTLLIFTLLSIFLIEFFFFSKDVINVFFLIVNSYHTGAFLMSLVCVFFSFKYIESQKAQWLIPLFLIGFLSVVSDRLFAILFAAPMCVTCFFLFRRAGIKTSLLLIAVSTVFTVAGIMVFKAIDTYPFQLMDETKPVDAKIILEQIDIFWTQISEYLLHFGFMALTLYLFIISLFLMAYVFFHSLKHTTGKLIPFYSLFSLVFSAAVICAPMVSGRYQGPDCLRYNAYPFYLAILNIAIFIKYKVGDKNQWKRARIFLIALNCLLLVLGISQLRPSGLKEFFNYYPDNVRFVDEIAEKENLKYGVANYWEAKKITMFSKKGVKVYAVFDDVSFYQHVANEDWFFKNKFNFVIFTNFTDTTLFGKKLKDITYVCNTPEFRLIKTRPFYYRREVGGTAINEEINEK